MAGDLPVGQNPVNPHLKKYSDLQKTQRRSIFLAIPFHQRGDTRSSRSRGGLRWTRRVRRTSAPEADEQNRVGPTPRRWCQVPGKRKLLRGDGGKKPGRR